MHDASRRQLAALLAAALAYCAPLRATELPGDRATQFQLLRGKAAVLASMEAKREDALALEKAFGEFVKKYPDDAEARLARGDFFWESGKHERALEDWRHAERIAPHSPEAARRLAQASLAAGDPRAAAAAFRRALKNAPEDPAVHFSLANVCFLFRHELLDPEHPTAESRLVEAISHFATASRLAPTNATYAKAYAETFYSLPTPDWTQAIDARERVRTVSPEPDFALLHLARIHLKLRRFGAARTCLDAVQSTAHVRLKTLLTSQLKAAIDSRAQPNSPGE